MSDQYGLPDFRQFMAGRTQYFPAAITQPTEPPFFLHCEPPTTAMVVAADQVGGQLLGFGHDSSTDAAGASQMDSGWMASYDGGNTRWPRQETLTLLEIRSRLDSKFKETNQKGPLWDEVSRIMVEEHGYQRSGKKCKEKFENLYKYYKKTKEGKAGRQGGKHYRFFRQLEAIYGEASNNHASASELHLARNNFPYHHHHHQIPNNMINQENQEVVQNPSLSFTNSSEFETSSSENNDDDLSAIAFMMNQGKLEKGKDGRKRWKAKVEDFVDSQMRKIIDTQEAWMERMLRSFESREQERVCKEEEWRKQEAARFDQEVHEMWAKERAWVEARDAALMGALKKLVGKEPILTDHENDTKFLYGTVDHNINRWSESEISSLIHLRNSLELRFQEGGYLEEGLWEEIAAKMASLGHDRSAIDYKEKWENISIYYNKKEKEDLDLRSNGFCQHLNSYICQGIPKQRPEISSMGLQLTVEGLPPSSSINVGESMWEKYGVSRLNKGKNQQV